MLPKPGKIQSALGEDAVTYKTCKKWFQRFYTNIQCKKVLLKWDIKGVVNDELLKCKQIVN